MLKTLALLENSALAQILHFSNEQIERVYAFYRDDTTPPPQKKNLCARVLFRQLKFMSNFVYHFQKMYVKTPSFLEWNYRMCQILKLNYFCVNESHIDSLFKTGEWLKNQFSHVLAVSKLIQLLRLST